MDYDFKHYSASDRYLRKLEVKQCNRLLIYILSEKKESIANILNSFALWTKFYSKAKEADVAWLQSQVGEDPQVRKYFDIYGLYDEKEKFVWGNYRLPPSDGMRVINSQVHLDFSKAHEGETYFPVRDYQGRILGLHSGPPKPCSKKGA